MAITQLVFRFRQIQQYIPSSFVVARKKLHDANYCFVMILNVIDIKLPQWNNQFYMYYSTEKKKFSEWCQRDLVGILFDKCLGCHTVHMHAICCDGREECIYKKKALNKVK